MWRSALAAATLGSAFCAAPAFAQSEDSVVGHVDSRENRLEHDVGPEGEDLYALDGGAKPFTLTVTLPFTWNSNVEGVTSDAQDAFHANPSIELAWERSISPDAIVYAFVGADQDLYTRLTENNATSLWGAIGIRGDSANLGFEPYVEYAPVAVYESGFGPHLVTLHDIMIGVTKGFPLGGAVTLTANAEFRRRESTSANSEQNRVAGSLELSGGIGGAWRWSAEQIVQGRFFTGGTNVDREDLNLASVLTLSWSPASAIDVDFGVYFEHNDSNREFEDFSVWDIGPSVAFSMRF